MRYQNTNTDKVSEVSNIMKRKTWIDPNAITPCHTVCNHIVKGNTSISSRFDFPVFYIFTYTPILSSQIYPKYEVPNTSTAKVSEVSNIMKYKI